MGSFGIRVYEVFYQIQMAEDTFDVAFASDVHHDG